MAGTGITITIHARTHRHGGRTQGLGVASARCSEVNRVERRAGRRLDLDWMVSRGHRRRLETSHHLLSACLLAVASTQKRDNGEARTAPVIRRHPLFFSWYRVIHDGRRRFCPLSSLILTIVSRQRIHLPRFSFIRTCLVLFFFAKSFRFFVISNF